MNRLGVALIVLVVLQGGGIGAQQRAVSPQAGTDAFEVASIRKVTSQDFPRGILPVGANGSFRAFLTVQLLILVAYGSPVQLLPEQVDGGPAWVRTDWFEIVAKAEGPLSEERLYAMMRALLAERFKLKLRSETRQRPVYDLVLDKGGGTLGPRLRRSVTQCESPFTATGQPDPARTCGFTGVSAGRVAAVGLPLDRLTGELGRRADVQRMVRDRTGLEGRFDFELQYTPGLPSQPTGAVDDRPAADPGTPLVTALREQLGLRLVPSVGPVDVLVIESVEQPTPD